MDFGNEKTKILPRCSSRYHRHYELRFPVALWFYGVSTQYAPLFLLSCSLPPWGGYVDYQDQPSVRGWSLRTYLSLFRGVPGGRCRGQLSHFHPLLSLCRTVVAHVCCWACKRQGSRNIMGNCCCAPPAVPAAQNAPTPRTVVSNATSITTLTAIESQRTLAPYTESALVVLYSLPGEADDREGSLLVAPPDDADDRRRAASPGDSLQSAAGIGSPCSNPLLVLFPSPPQ